MNIFLAFLIRSIIQLIAELFMSKGYFSHNVFNRIDTCNRTTTYFKEDELLDCKLFTIFMNYINSSVAHWFVFCEALYLYRLLRSKVNKDHVRWYILIGWCKLIKKIFLKKIFKLNLFSNSTYFNDYYVYNTIYSEKRFVYMLV